MGPIKLTAQWDAEDPGPFLLLGLFPSLGFRFFFFNIRMFYETAQVPSFMITGFAFLFLAVLNWTPRLSVATF